MKLKLLLRCAQVSFVAGLAIMHEGWMSASSAGRYTDNRDERMTLCKLTTEARNALKIIILVQQIIWLLTIYNITALGKYLPALVSYISGHIAIFESVDLHHIWNTHIYGGRLRGSSGTPALGARPLDQGEFFGSAEKQVERAIHGSGCPSERRG